MSKRLGHRPDLALHIHLPIRSPDKPVIDGFLVLLCNLLDQTCHCFDVEDGAMDMTV